MKLRVIRLQTIFCIIMAYGLVVAECAMAKNLKTSHREEFLVCALTGPCEFSVARSLAESEPAFLFYAKEVRLGHPRYREYSKSIDRFASAKNCWDKIETSKDSPAVFEFAWQGFHSIEDLEVCLFRLFQSFQSLEATKLWLERSDFSIRVEKKITPRNVESIDDQERRFSVNAVMDDSTTTTKITRSFFSSFSGWFGKEISITIIFDPSGTIEHLGVTVIRK